MNLDEFLREATEAKATDIYLVPGAIPCMSLEGRYVPMRSARGQRMGPETVEAFARMMLSEKEWNQFEETREKNMAYMAEGTDRFRVNLMWQRGSVGIVARRVVSDIPALRQLGLPPHLRDIAIADRGIVLVTGSTGSGKSTTLASMIEYRNNLLTGHIVTIEDPVEFVYKHKRSIVTQREVGIDTVSFHEALKNTLRQAPQVILIGELRDAETVQFAMHASETGHLVFATLHSTNSALAVERILHFYPGEMKEQVLAQLSLNLRAIICQRLVPKLRGGRIAAVELLINTPRVQDLLNKGEIGSIREVLNTNNQFGNVSFDRALYLLWKQKLVSEEDALQAADSANDLQMKFRGLGLGESAFGQSDDPWEGIQGDYDPPESMAKHQRFKDPSATGNYNNIGAPSLPPPVSKRHGGAMPPQQGQQQAPPRRPDGTVPVGPPPISMRPQGSPGGPPQGGTPVHGQPRPGYGPPPNQQRPRPPASYPQRNPGGPPQGPPQGPPPRPPQGNIPGTIPPKELDTQRFRKAPPMPFSPPPGGIDDELD